MVEAKDEEVHASVDDERRGEDRTAITLKVDYERLNTFFADYTKNISKGGTFIRTTKPLDVGTEFVFVLTVPEPKRQGSPPSDHEGGDRSGSSAESAPVRLELTGTVKWVVPENAATEHKPAGMGIQFLFENDAERQRVEQFVADLMRSSLGEHLAGKLLSSR
jgi:type IV pilus assembly protein PilZ